MKRKHDGTLWKSFLRLLCLQLLWWLHISVSVSEGVTFLASEIPVPLVSHVVILMTHDVIVQQSAVHHYVVCNVESGLSCVRQGAVVS